MKKFLSILTIMVMAGTFVFAQTPATPKKAAEGVKNVTEGPMIAFEATTVQYGTIEQGSDPYRVFTFTNEGTEPLVIKHAKASCGCTVPTYPKEPISPGESGEIKVRYDTKRVGPFSKRITLTTNDVKHADGQVFLNIKGKVEKKPVEPAGVPSNGDGMFNNGN
ncbi:MAG: DUF1573 domain-containing protein [Bacteroidetes bacterium]|nr:DUF1573 domain-containing protein [Bacteroidota bacterium]